MKEQQLQAILAYENEDIISRFTDMFDIEVAEAEDIFTETKKFLYLCQSPDIFIPDELLIIDEMWHNFILFTKVYHEFCAAHFGNYSHHLPASKQEKEFYRQHEASETLRSDFEARLEHVMSLVYDHFGEETVVKWFEHYPQQYSRENILKLRKP